MDLDPRLQQRLASMSQAELLQLRKAFPDDSPAQALIAPFEHRAFAREQAQTSPGTAWAIPGMALGYAGAKALGLHPARTPPSLDQIKSAFQGTLEGYFPNTKKE